jgi:hypothetical protein
MFKLQEKGGYLQEGGVDWSKNARFCQQVSVRPWLQTSKLIRPSEIEKLRSRVKELEWLSYQQSGASSLINTPQSSSAENTQDRIPKVLDGVMIQDPGTESIIHYGASSTTLFLNRLCVFLTSVLDQQVLVTDFLLGKDGPPQLPPGTTHCSRSHQESLLNLFWPTYGCLMPTVDETDFRKHFDSLWSESSRQSSPLADIILALCIQYAGKFVEDPDKDAASDWYFRRARASVAEEDPSISIVQSYIFLTIYLQNISRQTAAYAVLGTGVRIAYSLGFHLNPPDNLPKSDQELRNRIWWSLYILDTRLSVDLGRPFAIGRNQKDLPIAEDIEIVKRLGPHLVAENVCWLSFHVQNIKLAMAARSIHEGFSNVSLQYEQSARLEEAAEQLNHCMERLLTWMDQVPDGLKLKRKDGNSFSNDRTTVDVGGAPIWLQLQRISLELSYHTYISNFQRRFIYFIPHSMSTTPGADAHANAAVSHAITITSIIHQFLTKHDTIAEWYDFYNMQLNAALTMLAYTIAYPTCTLTPSARKSINTAIENMELFGISNAATLAKSLNFKSRVLMNRFRTALHVPAAKEDGSRLVGDSSSWLGDTFTESNMLNFDDMWSDIDHCDREMWANFLNELEMGLDGTMVL